MKSIFLSYFIFVLLIWSFLTTGLDSMRLAIGICIALLFSFATVKFLSRYLEINLPGYSGLHERQSLFIILQRIMLSLIFFPVFLYKIIVSAVSVATLAMKPEYLKPGIISYQTKLSNPFSTAVLANLVTLTPGTMSIGMEEDLLFIHCLRLCEENDKECVLRDVRHLELWVRRILE